MGASWAASHHSSSTTGWAAQTKPTQQTLFPRVFLEVILVSPRLMLIFAINLGERRLFVRLSDSPERGIFPAVPKVLGVPRCQKGVNVFVL